MRLNQHWLNSRLIQLLLLNILYTATAFSATTPQTEIPVDNIVLSASAACEKLYLTDSTKAFTACSKAVKEDPSAAKNWRHFGQIHLRGDQLVKAEQYFSRALQISHKEADSRAISLAINGLARVYRARGEIEKASEMFQESMKFCRAEKQCLARNQYLLAHLWLNQKVFSQARGWFTKCIDNAGEIENKKILVRCQFGLATIHKQNREFDKARPLCRSALVLYEALSNHKGMSDSLECLISIIENTGPNKAQWCDYSQQHADLYQKMGKFLQSITLQIKIARSNCS